MGRDIFDPFFVPATVRLRENQTVCVAGIVFRLEKPGVWNTETIVCAGEDSSCRTVAAGCG